MISSSFSLSINIKSRVPVLLLVILNGASKSNTISWLYKNLSSRVLNEIRDFAVFFAVSGRLFHGSVIRIGNTFSLKFSLALCVNNFRDVNSRVKVESCMQILLRCIFQISYFISMQVVFIFMII